MTPLVLLAGMMCDARLFAAQIEKLSRRRHVSCPHIGGHDTMRAIARDVLGAAPERFALAGLSMGGIVAMEMLRQAPQRVAGLALLDTNPLAEREEVKARRGPQIEAVRNGGLGEVMTAGHIPNYFTPGTDASELAALCETMAAELGEEVFVNQSMALRDRPDQCDTLRAWDGPSLVLCGREDRLCPPERHELMHGLLASSRLVIVEGAGHLPTLERPDKTTRALEQWLDEVDAHSPAVRG